MARFQPSRPGTFPGMFTYRIYSRAIPALLLWGLLTSALTEGSPRGSKRLKHSNVQSVCNGSDALPSQWTLLGPSQMPLHIIGRINAIAALPTEPTVVYAGGAFGGGVFRTNYTPGSTPK